MTSKEFSKTIKKVKKFIKKNDIEIEFELHNNVLIFALQPPLTMSSNAMINELEKLCIGGIYVK